MAFLITASHRLHYKTVGQPSHPPLLILHGFLGSCEDFAGVLPFLSEHFYCVLPDLPGHGQTSNLITHTEPNKTTNKLDQETTIYETVSHETTFCDDGYSFLETGRSLIALLNHLNIERTNLLGYSMGGRIALYFACHYPARIERTILESASPGLKTEAQRQARREKDEAIARQIEARPLQDFLATWYANPLFASLHRYPAASAAMLARRQNNSPIALAKALRGLGTGRQPSLWSYLHHIAFPLMLMAGLEDEKFTDLGQEIAKECEINNKSKVVLKLFEGCGHNIHLEIAQKSPETYADAVLSFLSVA